MDILQAGPKLTNLTVENLEIIWEQKAVALEGYIKGALGKGIAPSQRIDPDGLKQLVMQGLFFKNDLIIGRKDPVLQTELCDLIDYMTSAENIPKILKHFNLTHYAQHPTAQFIVPDTDFRQIDEQLVSPKLAEKWERLRDQVHEQYGVCLQLASGHRSFAYQLYLLVSGSYVKSTKGQSPNLATEFQTIAPPQCSQHNLVANHALDVANFIPNRPGITLNDATTCQAIRATDVWQYFRARSLEVALHENYPVGTINNGNGEPWEFQQKN